MKRRALHAGKVNPPVSIALTILILGSAAMISRTARPGALAGAPPVQVLLLSGQNNHAWQSTTPALKSILEDSGRFRVDIFENPARMTASSLAPYDVILSNWNAFGLDPAASAWPAEARTAYLDFVRGGKGHVIVHAGGSSFPDWKDYGRLVLAAWKDGQTSHGPRHEFPVRIDEPDHPITAGLEPFKTSDELWVKPGLDGSLSILASSYEASDQRGPGGWQPSVLAGRFGTGRTVALLLGHDADAIANPGFRALLRRSVEWAATGRVAPADGTALGTWTWDKKEGSSLALIGPAGVIWRFRFDAALDTPYFHPLNAAGGRTLTADRPLDHPWHHGLWFSWKFIDKVNYWEIDPKTQRPAGRTSWSNVRTESRKDHSAHITLDVEYRPAGESAPVLTEKRTIEISAPDAESVYAIDWTGEFTAVRTVVLDRTPLPGEPGGQAYGGYAGLSLRLAQAYDDRAVMTSDGPVAEMKDDRYRGRQAAVDYSGVLDGGLAGVAICDHPDNPRTPTPWYVIRSADFSFFTPALLCYAPLELKAGEKITLRYRVLVHAGRWDAARLRAEYERFAKSRTASGKEERP